ncbi:unnamed protein product, partial [marine sediment metagenome]
CELDKIKMLMKIVLHYSKLANTSLDSGIRVQKILEIKSKDKITDVKFEKDYKTLLSNIQKNMDQEFNNLGGSQ